jgi:hypothetical protein
MSSEDFVPPLAANMSAAFKKVSVAIGETNSVQSDLIATRIVELVKGGVYEIEELSRRALSSLKSGKPPSQQDEQTSLNEGLNLSASSPDLTHV